MRAARFLAAVAPLALVAGLGFGSDEAVADVFVYATIDKDKDVRVYENLDTDVDVDIDVRLYSDPKSGAKALSLLNQRNEYNILQEDYYSNQDADQNYSVLYNNGITNLNQAAGHQNNQGNSVAAAVTPNDYYDGFAEAQSSAEQQLNGNWQDSYGSYSDANLYGSVNFNNGITNDNQAAGHQNNQGNAVSLAMAFGNSGVALAESDLGQFNTWNVMYDSNGYRTAMVNDSINYNMGITNVNQASGSQNNQGNAVSLATVNATSGLGY